MGIRKTSNDISGVTEVPTIIGASPNYDYLYELRRHLCDELLSLTGKRRAESEQTVFVKVRKGYESSYLLKTSCIRKHRAP